MMREIREKRVNLGCVKENQMFGELMVDTEDWSGEQLFSKE